MVTALRLVLMWPRRAPLRRKWSMATLQLREGNPMFSLQGNHMFSLSLKFKLMFSVLLNMMLSLLLELRQTNL